MKKRSPKESAGMPCFLGVEGGGTRTVAVLTDAEARPLRRQEFGPGNVRLLDDRALRSLLRELAAFAPEPAAVGLGLAGARIEEDRARLRRLAGRVWSGRPLWLGNDLETALAAASEPEDHAANVLVLSGTGSCCYGQDSRGRTARVGGWGQVLGDRGSGHSIAQTALREIVSTWDRRGRWPKIGARILRRLALNHPEDLVDWSLSADKGELAGIASEVFAVAEAGDRTARGWLRAAAQQLADDALACARKLARPGQGVRFILAGGCLLKSEALSRPLRQALRRGWPGARVERFPAEGAVGAARLAIAAWRSDTHEASSYSEAGRASAPILEPDPTLPIATGLAPTEERHPASMDLDRLPLAKAVRLFIEEDEVVTRALLACQRPLERAVRWVTRTLRAGGRLIYVGAGTSGRLGVLDASECPPTFRASPETVQGIIAGGREALWRSIEGAEDDDAAGAAAIGGRAVNARDVVFGIAASGRTPFVWGALNAARAAGAKTVLLCFNPRLRFPCGLRPDLVICPETGPELLTGSTRLKAGTATKRVLNLVTTLSMTRLGKVRSNLMVDVLPANRKLRDRAVRLVVALTRAGEDRARAALEKHDWVVTHAAAALPAPKAAPDGAQRRRRERTAGAG